MAALHRAGGGVCVSHKLSSSINTMQQILKATGTRSDGVVTFSPLALLMALRGRSTRRTRRIFTTEIALELQTNTKRPKCHFLFPTYDVILNVVLQSLSVLLFKQMVVGKTGLSR